MAKSYKITINNGSGQANVLNDNYSVTANIKGYSAETLNPKNITVDSATGEYKFTVAGAGTLNIHVSEEGEAGGTPIVGATFYRTNSVGDTFGEAITTNDQGVAVFQNVPFAETDAPNIYFKQIASDGNHNFDTSVITLKMTQASFTKEIQNTLPVPKTFTVSDANYTNLPIESGEIDLA